MWTRPNLFFQPPGTQTYTTGAALHQCLLCKKEGVGGSLSFWEGDEWQDGRVKDDEVVTDDEDQVAGKRDGGFCIWTARDLHLRAAGFAVTRASSFLRRRMKTEMDDDATTSGGAISQTRQFFFYDGREPVNERAHTMSTENTRSWQVTEFESISNNAAFSALNSSMSFIV